MHLGICTKEQETNRQLSEQAAKALFSFSFHEKVNKKVPLFCAKVMHKDFNDSS